MFVFFLITLFIPPTRFGIDVLSACVFIHCTNRNLDDRMHHNQENLEDMVGTYKRRRYSCIATHTFHCRNRMEFHNLFFCVYLIKAIIINFGTTKFVWFSQTFADKKFWTAPDNILVLPANARWNSITTRFNLLRSFSF